MMYGHFAGMSASWLVSLLVTLVVVGGVIAMLATVARGLPRTSSHAERMLAERFARGEIDTEEYEERLRVLNAAHR
ncbi:SHOCT domain-containing protein [Actinoplanes sp. NPDC051851]|uniref:SHOCT domain-containing protein n=1 Tax=Actinoplanes sp. NPDC051851 TaxID=3154753 RepID=UPI003449D5DB